MSIHDRNIIKTIQSVEGYLDALERFRQLHIVFDTSRLGGSLDCSEDDLSRTEYGRYITSAHFHYFVARVLFMRVIFSYSNFFFCRCIENYLKAFIGYHRGIVPAEDHNLSGLLAYCRAIPRSDRCFIDEPRIETIVRLFEPFNEIDRRQRLRVGPECEDTGVFYPDEILNMDYFVFQMRNVIPLPGGVHDMFIDGSSHFELSQCEINFPEFYRIVKQNNINFPDVL